MPLGARRVEAVWKNISRGMCSRTRVDITRFAGAVGGGTVEGWVSMSKVWKCRV